MTDSLERQTVIDLLNKLGDEQDDDVLAAARALHSQISTSGMSWEELLVPEGGAAEPDMDDDHDDDDDHDHDDDDDDGHDDEDDNGDEDAEQPAPLPPVGDDSDTLELIEKLLARPGISDNFREELEDYKTDLADGEFEESDHRYVRALYARLSKS
ncbi:MAG: hypothetical protein HOK82_04275 [Rhodospirillaceae bacterium]|jgi:hypothetical protein|nr:hypothetical protein [Rhodospirillaceae bacterium]